MRKSSKARLFSTCLTGAVLAASAPAWGQTSDAPTWKPRAEVQAQAGEDIGVSTSLFAPVAQNDSSLVYVDGRIGYDQRFDRNGSATVGARFRTSEDTAIGVNVGADFYRSDIGSRDQAALSMGLEGFSSIFDVRVNYRLPLSKTQTIGFIDPAATTGTGALVLENNRLIERRNGFRLEAIPLQGFNGEAGVRLPVGDNASIRGSVGGFDYWDRKADDSYRGYRVGLEMDVEDNDSGARFTFGGTLEHTDRFGTDARATVRLSVPFGGRAGDRGASPTGLDRQMGDRVRRDYVARSGSRYTDLTTTRLAVDARTGNQFGGFYYASGTGAAGAAGTIAAPTTIADAVSRAGANGVVVALGSGGNINTAGVTLATNQYLVGGAGAVDVRLVDGSTVQYALGGTNGVVVGTSAAGAAVTLGQGSVVRDVTVRGAGVGIAANGVGGFAVERTIVENTGGAGIALTNTLGAVSLTGLTVRGGAGAGVLINGGSSVALANSTISGGAGAIDINDGGATLSTALSNLTLSATGGNVLDIDGSGTGTVTVTALSGITIRGGTGETGGLSVRSATFDASTTTAGIQTVNAGRMEVGTTAARVNGQGVFLTDVTGSLSFADLDIANSGATGLHVVNAKVNSFTLATLDGTIDTVGGTAADLDPLVINLTFAGVSSLGAAGPGVILNTVEGGGTGGNALTIGTLTVSNSGGDGLVILNSTGLVRVNGGTIGNSGGNSVQIGEQGVAGSGGSVNLIFGGAITDTNGALPIVAIFNARGTINFTGPISGSGGILVQDTLAGSAISFGAISLTGTAGDAIVLDRLAGSINFAGLVTIANPGANGIVIGTVPGGVTFGDVDITGLGNFNGVDVRNTQGTVLFNTLDITGTAGTGINVTGSTNAGNVMTIAGGTIQGVDVGVDLTQANMTGQFRFGDGSATPMNSTISADVPLVIALMNAANGSYNFADANLVGDISNLTGSGFTAYYALVGATGAGTRDDPGSLAGADASNAQYIVLLNNPAGGQDVFDAASAGGSFDLAAGQSLVSFLTGDFLQTGSVSLPANLVVTGIGPAGISNPYAGSGAAVLTSTAAGSATVNLANNSTINGVVIRNAGGDVGVEGSGVSNARILNADISGVTGAIAIDDGGVASSVQLTHLDLASTSGTTLALSGAGAGTLTVSGADIDIVATGSSAALSLVDLTSGGLGFGSVSTAISATGAVSVQNVTGGNLVFGSISAGGTTAGAGVSIGGSSSAVTIQSISASGTAGDAVNLTNNSGAIIIGSISASASGGDAVELTGNGAVTIGGLSVSGAGGAGLNIQDSQGTVSIGGGAINAVATGVSIDGVATGTGISIGTLNLNGTTGSGITLADVDGSVLFTGTTNISGVGVAGIVVGAGSAGSITFGDVNITGLGAGRTGVDGRNASGTVSFNTLDITGSSITGTRGIDLTGATFATSFSTVESGNITGVGIGVDLTNASITGSFRDGDGSSTDADGAASTISAVVPIEIAGLNGASGTYNFADVNLVGDTSGLVTSATTFYVRAGATGAGTLSDPGSLAGAEASGAQVIVLLNDPTGGQDTLDGASAGGSFDLAAGQWLLSFLNGDTLTLPGGGPANLTLHGITPGQIVNPFAGSGAPILTNSAAGAGLTLASNTLVDGVVINAPNGSGIVAFEAANVTIRNSMIRGSASAITLADGAAGGSAALTNLRLAGGAAVLTLDGSGLGALTVTALDDIEIAGGNGEIFGILGNGVVFDADLATAGIQTVTGALTVGSSTARVSGTGLLLQNSEGAVALDLDVATDGGSGVSVTGGIGGLRFDVTGGTIDATNSSGGYGLYLQDVSSLVRLDSILHTGTGTGVSLQNVTGAGALGLALDVTQLSVADGAAGAILLTGNSSGTFHFGAGSTIGTTTGAAITLSNSSGSPSAFSYLGNITYAGVDALLRVDSGHNGAVTFGAGTLSATSGLGLVFQNADGSYTFGGTTNLAAGISISGGSSGSFTFGADTEIVNPAGIAIDIQNSTASFAYAGSLTYSGGAAEAINVANHTGGVIGFTTGAINITTGTGIRFTNADSNYSFVGPVNLDAGTAGIVVTGGSAGTFFFGSSTSVTNSGGVAFEISNSTAAVGYAGYLSATGGTALDVVNHGTGQLDFQNATLDLGGATTLRFDNADGTYLFGSFATAGGSGIAVLNGSSGNFHFYDVDIAEIGAGQTAVNLTGATGFITFETLDIAGIDPTGSKGIDLTGSTTTANIIVDESSSITGVGIGVDLTNAAMSGVFRYGDGSSAVPNGAASLIDAVTPLVITGLNPGVGTYNFQDVVLVGDTSALNTSRTIFWVQAGAAGAGTRSDPGSLAAAEAAAVDVIILLDTQVAGQDVIDGASAGGGLDLDANQTLLSFLNGDTLNVGGGAPSNLLLFGVSGGVVTNPNAGSGAPLLTTTQAGANTVNLASGTVIDGVRIGNLDARGVYGSGVAGATIRNSVIQGGVNAIQLIDNGGAANVALSNLTLSSGTGDVLSLIGSGGGQLVITQLSGITITGGGTGAGLYGDDVVFDANLVAAGAQEVAATVNIGTLASRAGGSGLVLDGATGVLRLATTVFNADGDGVFVDGSGTLTLTLTGAINTGPVTASGAALNISDLLADIQLASVTYAGTDTGVIANDVTGIGTGGRALDIGVLTVSSGAANGIFLGGTTNGNFTFGGGSSITGTTVAGVELANTGTGSFNYAGSITGVTTGALVYVHNGDVGNAVFGGSLNATGGTGLQFDNADGTYTFLGNVALNGGDAGIDIVNGSSGNFLFETGTSVVSPTGVGIDIQNSTAAVHYRGNLTFATPGQTAINIVNHSGGTILFQGGTLTATGGGGVRFNNADGTYEFGAAMSLGGGSDGILITNGSGGTFNFGAGTSVTVTLTGLSLSNSAANVSYAGTLTASMPAAGAAVSVAADQSTVNLASATLNVSNGTGLSFSDADGSYSFGSFALSGGAGIAVTSGSSGTFAFGDVDVTGIGLGQTAVNLTGATGNVTFATLDITGSSTTGSKGIDLTGNTGAGNIIVTNSSSITGVGVGVDLTNASRAGNFQYGDGESLIDVASAITATTPIVIAGLNGAIGDYNFLDVQLTGNTAPLEVNAFFVRAGATGVGSAVDPGSLAAADASGATYIVLLDAQAGAGADTITGTIDLADGQSLVSFLNGDALSVAGGAPANVRVYGITGGNLTNPTPGTGAPVLSSADATGTVRLGGTSVIDGVVIANTGTGAGIYASGTSGTATIRNSTISGGGAGINLLSGAATRTVNLQNLTLRNGGNQAGALLNINGTGGTLTVTGMSNLTIDTSGGETAGLVFNTVTFDSNLVTAGIQAVNAGAFTIGTNGARVQGDGLSLTNVSGALTFTDIDIANNAGTGLLVANSKANNFLLTTLDGSVDTTNGTAVNLDPLNINITLAAVGATGGAYGILLDQVEGDFTVTGAVSVTGATTAGIAIQDNTAQTDALVATFNGAVSINNTAGDALSFVNNSGATIHFAGGGAGVDLVTTAGVGLRATGGGAVSIAGAGNSIATTTARDIVLDGVTVASGGVNFASVTATNAANGVVLTNVTSSGGGAINLGVVDLQGITTRGVDINGSLGAALTITDLDILLGGTGVAFDLNGATLSAGIAVGDFDVNSAPVSGNAIGVDLRGATGGQTVRLGDSAVGGTASSIAAVGTGVYLDATTNLSFVFGDGESAIDGNSTISATNKIDASVAPVAGTYDFRDVTFGASPGLGFGVGRTWFVDSNGATGGGNGSGVDGANPMTLAAAELALAPTDVIVLINNGAAISAAGSNGNDTLALIANTQVRGFGQGPLALTLVVPSTILLSGTTINIADPTANGAATLTSAAGGDVITLGASGNRISGFILDGAPGGALRGIVDNGGSTGAVVNFMTIRNFNAVGGYGVEITPSTNATIDNAAFIGNTNDILLNAAGSTISNVTATGATGISIAINNATGTTALTNVNISGAATGLSFTTPGGTINATNVDIAGAGTSALTVGGGTASFNFDAASSIVQAGGGLSLNFTGNHTTGTFAYAGLINATSGAGMQFSNADGTYNFTGTTTLNGGDAGIDIYNGATGTFSFGSGTTLTHNGAGNAFVLLSSANLTFDGTITDNNGVAVEIDGHDAGTATFNGAISSSIANASTVISVVNSNAGAINFNGQMNIASTGTVVSLSDNSGGTITFNAGGTGLDITGTTGTGLLITGGGVVDILGSGNSIATTSGALLNLSSTGATTTTVNLNFASASNTGGANGVVVNRTAGTMTGTVGITGGAITATTRGVSLTGDALTFTYGGTITTSGAAARSVEATSRTGGTATLSGNLTDTSLGISATNNTGGTINFTGQTISLNTGANAAVTLGNNTGATVNFAPAGGGNGLDIVTTSGTGFSGTGGGTVIVTGAGNSIQTGTGQVVNLSGVFAGAGGINFASLQNTGTVAGIAINLNNLDSSGGGAFSGGTTSVAATSGGNDGIFVGNGSSANVAFGTTTIGTGTISGDGIEVNGSGNGTVTFASVAIGNTTGHGVSIIGAAGTTGAISINGGTIGASVAGDGVNITGGNGSVTVAAAITRTSAGNIVEVANHSGGAIAFSGNLSATGGAANGILLNNNSGGTIAFSGATKTLSTGINHAVQFDNTGGTGAAVSFTGGNLDIDTTTGRGITGSSTTAGAGSLTITGSNNTIASVGGIALNLVNTNIAAGGLNFLSVAANGGDRGIALNNTGSTAGLTVTGSGTTDGSGGTIQNTTTRGLELINTAQVSISNVNLNSANSSVNTAGDDLLLANANAAIYLNTVATAVFENINITGTTLDNGVAGLNVSNFQLNNSLIDGAGNGAHESGIEFRNLSGTSSLTNTEIRFSETNSLDIVNTDVSLNLTLNNVIFRDTQTVSSGGATNANGEGGLQFRSFSNAAGSPTTNIDIVDSDFLRLRTQAIQIIGEDDSTVSVDIVNNQIASQADIGAGIDINGNDTATVNFNINNNTIQSQGGASVNITSFLDANAMGRITGNTITANGSGAGGSGVRVVAQETSQTIVSINTNNITAGAANNSTMIDMQARFDTARLDATVNGNTINSDTTAVADINITSGSSTAGESNQVYVDIANNIIVAGGPTNLLRLRVSDVASTNRLFLTGFVEGGAGIEDDAVATWNAKGNTPGLTAGTVNVSLTGTAVGPVAGTAMTPTNPVP